MTPKRNYHRSFRAIKKQRLHDRAMKGVEGKRRKMLESPAPDYPDNSKTVLRCAYAWGDGTIHRLVLLQHSKNRYWVWVDRIKQKRPMGLTRAKRLVWGPHNV